MHKLHFSKMHGAGNDFIVIDAVRQNVRLNNKQVKLLADRRHGIGCDQILLLEPPQQLECDFSLRIYNSDGSESGQCGNGARCLGHFLHLKDLAVTSMVKVHTTTQRLELHLTANGATTVNMGLIRLQPQEIPFLAPIPQLRYELLIHKQNVQFSCVNLGNPHAVIVVQDLHKAPFATIAPLVAKHSAFPEGANVSFMQILPTGIINLRIYERGSGETTACGSAACAAVVVARLLKLLDISTVTVQMPGGSVIVEWSGAVTDPVWLQGPSCHVFDGKIEF